MTLYIKKTEQTRNGSGKLIVSIFTVSDKRKAYGSRWDVEITYDHKNKDMRVTGDDVYACDVEEAINIVKRKLKLKATPRYGG